MMQIEINAEAPEPVYEQIVRQIQEGVTVGALPAGMPLPPVRQLANDLVLNRNTVARAYKMLEDQGVIETAGRKGTFVRAGAAEEVVRVKTGQAERVVRRTVQSLVSDGLSTEQIAALFQSALAVAAKGGTS
jgi:DNA-binding transcriptional regulator YhcF (GntR family)